MEFTNSTTLAQVLRRLGPSQQLSSMASGVFVMMSRQAMAAIGGYVLVDQNWNMDSSMMCKLCAPVCTKSLLLLLLLLRLLLVVSSTVIGFVGWLLVVVLLLLLLLLLVTLQKHGNAGDNGCL